MSKQRKAAAKDVDTLTQNARHLLDVTSEITGDAVAEARERLSAALEDGQEVYGDAKERVIAGAKAGDKFVRGNPYAAAGIAVGAGAVIGYMLGRRTRP